MAEAALFLAQHGIDIGRNRLFKWARDKKLLCSQKRRYNKPTQKGIESGIVNIEVDPSGNCIFTTRTMITPEGLKSIFNSMFAKEYPLGVLFEEY